MLHHLAIALSASLLGSTSPPPGVQIGSLAPRGGHALGAEPHAHGEHDCVPPAMREWLRARVEENRRALALPRRFDPRALGAGLVGPASSGSVAADESPTALAQGGAGGDAGGGGGVELPLYRFFPLAGNFNADVVNGGFVDLEPTSPGYTDFDCRGFSYDGHEGIDAGLRSFAEQFIGVPVFAARDGVVVFAQDGWPDTNVAGGVQGNIVAIDHGDGVESQYYHLKKDSVAVTLGQVVKAGQQIGQAGSSGNSFGPHLHFQTMIDGVVYEPFAGPCGAGESGWENQAPLDSDELFLHDFGITRTDLFTLPKPWWEPWPLPTDGQIQLDDPAVVFWWFVYNFPEDCLIRVRFYRPDQSLAWDAQWNWGNTELWRTHKNWFGFSLPPMGPVAGTWRLRFELDGKLMIDTPFEIVANADPLFNRPPEPVALTFDPPAPKPEDVLFCRVQTTTAMEDRDWDVVRYRYVWRVNGAVVRDVTTAAQSDALPRDSGAAGATVSCEVTPNDGEVNGPLATASVVLAASLVGDLDGDGAVNGADLGTLLSGWGGSNPAFDLDGSGAVGGGDLGLLLANWTG